MIIGILCLSTFSILVPFKVKADPSIDISARYSSFINAYNNYKQIFGQDVSIGQTVDRTLAGVVNDPLPHYQWRSWAGQTYPGMDGFSIRIETVQPDYVYKIIGMGYMAGGQPSASGWVQVNSPFKIEQINYMQNLTYGNGNNVYIYVDASTGRIDLIAQWTNWPALIDAPAFEFAITIAKPGGTLPPFSYDTTRTRAAHAFDFDTKSVVMFGGYTHWTGVFNPDVWTFDPSTSQWTLQSASNQPVGRTDASMSYDSLSKSFLVFGGGTTSGEASDTWTFQLSGGNTVAWAQIPVAGPSARALAPTAFDSKNDLHVLFGGGQYVYNLGDTWVFDPGTSTWSNMNPSSSPTQRLQPGMAYDTKSGKTLLFGGLNKGAGSLLSDTWIYDAAANAWQQITTANAPSPRQAPSLACDGNGVFYLFGGWNMDADGNSQYLSDTWKFDMATMQWTQLSPSASPMGQSQGAFMYIGGSRFILINGWRDSTLGEIWYYDAGQNKWAMTISQPNFEISVSPTPNILLHVGGWNDSASLILKSINGFSGSIQSSFSGPSEANIYIGFTENPVYLSAGSQVTVGIVVSSTSAALSEYTFVIAAESGSIRHELSLTIKLVGNSDAITNLVHLQEIAASDPPFSIQQNFMIAAPNGTAIYWGQNIIQIGRNIPILSRRIAISIFQVFSKPDWKTLVINEKRGILAPKLVSFPVVFNLTSHIDGNTLVLENNASSRFNTAHLSLPEGSYIIGYPGPGYGYTHQAPEIVIVGLPFQGYLKVATFRNPTKGFVESYVKLVGESGWRQTQNVILNLENDPQTAEESRNLKWLFDGTFQYSSGSTDQGITFSPNYH